MDPLLCPYLFFGFGMLDEIKDILYKQFYEAETKCIAAALQIIYSHRLTAGYPYSHLIIDSNAGAVYVNLTTATSLGSQFTLTDYAREIILATKLNAHIDSYARQMEDVAKLNGFICPYLLYVEERAIFNNWVSKTIDDLLELENDTFGRFILNEPERQLANAFNARTILKLGISNLLRCLVTFSKSNKDGVRTKLMHDMHRVSPTMTVYGLIKYMEGINDISNQC